MMSCIELGVSFQSYFGSDTRPKLDGLLSYLAGRPVLDLKCLENALSLRFGEYEGSMHDLILRNYGEECLSFCMEAFALD